MKKLILFLFLVVLFSCEKQHCKTCIIYYYQTHESKPIEYKKYIDCDKSIVSQIPDKFPAYVRICD